MTLPLLSTRGCAGQQFAEVGGVYTVPKFAQPGLNPASVNHEHRRQIVDKEARPMTDAKQKSSLEISETFWGYIVRAPQDRFDRETVMESAMRFFGLILILLAYGQWLLPSSLFAENVMVLKSAFSVIFAGTGVAMYVAAGRGFRQEVQIDLGRREVRFALRNTRRQSRLTHRLPMDGVESAFIKRSKADGGEAVLYFRLFGVEAPLEVVAGHLQDVERLHLRLCHDLSPRDARLARGLRQSDTRVTGVVPTREQTAA